MTRLLAFGDIQYGHPAGGPARVFDRLEDQARVGEQIARLAVERQVDAVICGGDVFEVAKPRPWENVAFRRLLDPLAQAGIPVIAINGNHDVENADRPSALEVFASPAFLLASQPRVFTGPGYSVACLPWSPTGRVVAAHGGGDRDDLNAYAAELLIAVAQGMLADMPTDGPRLLLSHWSVDAAVLPNGMSVADMREPMLPLAALEELGYDAIILSHIHAPQLLGLDDPVTILYTGSPLPLNHGEAGCEHGVWVLDFGPGGGAPGGHCEFVALESRPFLTIDVPERNVELLAKYGVPTDQRDVADAIVRVRYEATPEQARRIDQRALEAALVDAGAWSVKVEPHVTRESRARVEGLDESLSDEQAVDMWLGSQDVNGETGPVRELALGYLAKVGASSGRAGGGMKPIAFRARNYRSFESIEFTFPDGPAVVSGPNGAGKSALVNAPELALFADGRELRRLLNWDGVATELELEFTFVSGGETYRVRRSFSARGNGKTALDFERLDGDVWTPLTLPSQKETQAAVEAMLGFDRETLRASAFMRQRDAGAFASADPRDRKRILGQLVGLDRFERAQELARADKAATASELAALKGALDRAEAELEGLPAAVDRLAAAVEAERVAADEVVTAELQAEAASNRHAQAVEARRDVDTLRAEHIAADTAWNRLQEVQETATVAAERIPAVQAELAALPSTGDLAELERVEQDTRAAVDAHRAAAETYQAAVREAELAGRERAAIVAQAADFRRKASDLDAKANTLRHEPHDDDVCETCGQTLGAEAREAAVAHWQVQAGEFLAAAADLDVQARAVVIPEPPAQPEGEPPTAAHNAATLALREAREQAVHAATLGERLRSLQATAALAEDPVFRVQIAEADLVLRGKLAKLADAEAHAPTAEQVQALGEQASSARARVNAERDRLAAAQADRVRAQADHDRLRALADTTAADRERRDELNVHADRLGVVDRMLGRDGIPALIVENVAIPVIETEANRVLGLLGGKTAGARIELHTQKATQAGELRDALEIAVVHGPVQARIEDFSGGEQFRLNVALRAGLTRLLETKRGADCRLLVIDEPEGLDADGFHHLADVLRELGYDTILVVTHDERFKDTFAQVIEIADDGHGSRILSETAAVVA